MQGLGASPADSCPFSFNYDPASFKAGDCVSYRVTGSLSCMPFVGTLVEVHDDHVILCADPQDPSTHMRATRESRPVVQEEDMC